MSFIKDKDGSLNIRLIILLIVIMTGVVAAIFYFPPVPTQTAEALTNGSIIFTDKTGNVLPGTIEVSIAGATKETKENVNSVNWNGIPNVRISFNALETAHVSINFRISGDSQYGKVAIENYGIYLPDNAIRNFPPGSPIKYVEISQQGVSFSEAVITIKYRAIELRGHDETSLAIYRHDGTNWVELPSVIDTTQNTVSTTVSDLSVFALVAKPSENIEIIDTEKAPLVSEISTYDENRQLIKRARTASISSADFPGSGDFEVDALQTKNVAVRLKLKVSGGGKVILDDHGRNNPVYEAAPGNAIKYVDISAPGFDLESAEVKIHYTDEELGNVDENALGIYHWNGAAWESLPTGVDAVNNVLTATTTSLSPFAVSGGTGGFNKILVATDRYVVLDDWQTGTASTNYVVPNAADDTTNNNFIGRQTTIGTKALLIDSNGTPLQSKTVNFTIFRPGGTYATGTGVTDSSGVASFYRDLSGANFWGNWTVKADYSGVSKNSSFIYNWWGCAWNQGSCAGQHSGANPSSSGTTSPNSPYTRSWEQITVNRADHNTGISGAGWADDYCTVCHQNYDGNPTTGNTAATTTKDFYTPDVHRNIRCDNASCHNPGTNFANHNAGTITIGSCSNCHNRTDISMKSTLNGVVSNYSNASSSSIIDKYHTPNSTVPCIICHGPMHNITKPDESQRFIKNNNTEDSQCKTCHASYTEHNSSNTSSNGVNCTLCHSDDVHGIQVFSNTAGYVTLNKSNPNPARGNCTECHQNSTFLGVLKNITINPKAGNYTGRDPPQIPVIMSHSTDTANGSKWNSSNPYWTNTSQKSMCNYCHGFTMHKSIALGRPSLWDGNNTVNSTIGNTTWCTSCHWQKYSNGTSTYNDMVTNFTGDNKTIPPEITNGTYSPNTVSGYSNHTLSAYNDSTCNGCHGKPSYTNITFFLHSVSPGGGGPDCVSCHDIGGSAPSHVNVTAANDPNAIHKNMNSGASASNASAYYANNKRCWFCHGDNGTEPTTSLHPSRYKTPRRCPDCHLPDFMGGSNHATGLTGCNCHFNIPYPLRSHLWNGTNIFTPAVSTCYDCHNKSEMLIPAKDPDNGTGAVYGGLNGGNNSPSHYGTKRADLIIGGNTNCSYCHQNTTTAFATAMIDPVYNSSISNHSLRYNSSSPSCTSSQCHNTGRMHDQTLTKPNITMPNSVYCLNCHGSNGSGGTNYTGAVTGIKAKHNNSVDCSECHLNTSRDIHPVKYLQANASYNTSNSTGVNCVICHQGTAVDSNLSKTPPKIPNPLHHSDNLSNGSIWGAYWTNNSPQTACIYCHNDTKHNATPLGRILQWSPNYSTYRPIGNNYTCSDCHYRGDLNYSQMNSSFISAGLPIPPEITNGTSWNGRSSGYYNHTLSDYVDVNCKTCHGYASANMSDFLHNVSKGGDCKGCHFDYAFMNSSAKPERYINSTMFNNSPHVNLKCEDCHTKGHNNIGARKACEDCHAYQSDPKNQTDRHNITGDPLNYKIGAVSVVNITDCTICHDAALYANATSTYGSTKTRNCDYCHTYPDKTYS